MYLTALRTLALISFCFAAYITIDFMYQPFVAHHAFRQTQTAITSYWMIKDGWQLAYQTPVLGYPWAIPLEFPLYQTIVAAIAIVTGADLAPIGRIVSFLFLAACMWPAFAVARRLKLPEDTIWIFSALFFTAPTYLFWGRAFLIETTALFFTLACLPFAIDIIRREGGGRSKALFVVLATIAVAQKSTTAAPVLLFLLSWAILSLVNNLRSRSFEFKKAFFLLPIALPLLLGSAWMKYAESVRLLNEIENLHTTHVMFNWVFGTLEQRLSLATYAPNITAFTIALLSYLIIPRSEKSPHNMIICFAILFTLPKILFFNLYNVHDYYKIANDVFYICALTLYIAYMPYPENREKFLKLLITTTFIFVNLSAFYAKTLYSYDEDTQPGSKSTDMRNIGIHLKNTTEPGSGVVVFGNDWSSVLPYYAERKAVMVMYVYPFPDRIWADPQRFLGPLPLSAIVVCAHPKNPISAADVQKRLASEPSWVHENAYGCDVLRPRMKTKITS